MRALGRVTLGIIAVVAAVPAIAGKIGFVDAERAAVTVQEGKSELKVMEEWAKLRKQRIDQLQEQVKELSRGLAASRASGPAERTAAIEAELIRTQRELEDEARSFNREVEERREKVLTDLGAKIGTVASEYAEANGFDAVFLLGVLPMAYYSKELEITDTVIRLYDERFPVKPGS